MKIAIIHARGGSQRIPRKNIKLNNSRPMMACSIQKDMDSNSFDQVLVSTDDKEIATIVPECGAHILSRLSSHGSSSDPAYKDLRHANENWNYQQLQLAFNYSNTEMQTTLSLSQLKKLGAFVLKQHALATVYDKALQDLSLIKPWQDPESYSRYHLFAILLKPCEEDTTQQQVCRPVHKVGIQVNLHYIPVYLQPFYAAMGFKRGYCPKAENYFKQTIRIPKFMRLSNNIQISIVKILKDSYKLIKQFQSHLLV